MQKSLISILMPVKNAMPYLKECLDSIINQTYLNWELIAINDHSTDDSFELLKQYADKNHQIKCLNNDGNGIIDALQLAFNNCSGEFITRMDADDIMQPEKLEVLLDGLINNGLGYLAVGQVTYFSASSLGDGYISYQNWLNKLTKEGTNFNELYKECVIPSPCWMVHRVDFEKCNGFNNDWYPEDYDLCFRFYETGLKCIPCNQQIHLWRDYSSRTSRTHEHYADNQFTTLKCHYFAKLNRDRNSRLILWGAGKRGKSIAKQLNKLKLDFQWVCNNPNKIGHHIYGKELTSIHSLNFSEAIQIIVAVANKEEQKKIVSTFQGYSLKPMKDYFFFC